MTGSICAIAGLTEVTPHVLRHTFTSVAGNLNFSELTIKGLLGHSPRGVTQGYVHLDYALVVAAERVSAEIAAILDGKSNESQLRAYSIPVRPDFENRRYGSA